MKKTTILLCFLLVVISCGNDESTGTSNTNWRTGSEGIVMRFAENTPPSEVLNGQTLNVIVEVTNKGATDIDNINFYSSGYDKTIIDLKPTSDSGPDLPLEGKSAFNPEGSLTDYVSWKANVNSPPAVDSFSQDITITACYQYQTIANPEICIDPQKYDYTASSRCNFDVKNLGSNQGGPIAVTQVRQKTTNDKIYLEIHFQNVGNGVPFAGVGVSIDNCHTNLGYADINTVDVDSVKLATSTSFTCKPTNPIRLSSGKGYIVCETPLSGGGSYYVSPLLITFNYNYRQSITKQITVVNIPES